MPLSSPPAAPQRGDRTTFAQRVDAFITWLIGFVSELNIFSANLNSIAAGGAYAIPYVQGSVGSPSGGKIAPFGGGSQIAATQVHLDYKDAAGMTVTGLIDSMVAGVTSATKGTLRLVSTVDPAKFAVYSVTGLSDIGTNKVFSVTAIAASSADPFAAGEALMLFFQRTGDKGDTGQIGKFPILWVRDEKTTGTAGSTGGHVVGSSNVRTLNTVMRNEISGASLASNRITLPAGTYRFRGSVPANGVGAHRALIYNITAGNATVHGTNEYDTGACSRSLLDGDVTFAVSTTLEVRHYLSSTAGNLGPAVGPAGVSETYTEVIFEKVA